LLHTSCPHLESFKVDAAHFRYFPYSNYPARDHFEAEEFLALLTKFEELKVLWLVYDLNLISQTYKDSDSTGPDYDDAETIMRSLHRKKQGVPFERIDIERTAR